MYMCFQVYLESGIFLIFFLLWVDCIIPTKASKYSPNNYRALNYLSYMFLVVVTYILVNKYVDT